MFAPAILPLELTVVFVGILVLGSIAILPRYGYRPRKVAVIACISSMGLFLPSFIGIGFLVDLVRYGTFSYQSASEISDPYVRLPASGTDVTLVTFASGHDARFTIQEGDLLPWLESQGLRPDDSARMTSAPRPLRFPARFSKYDWAGYDDMERNRGPRSARGAGFDVWYSTQHQIAYLSASYW